MRSIKYTRYEYTRAVAGEDDEPREGTLLTFVYDIPYFDACGIFPPFHIVNEILNWGTSGGGMSPGTEWEPFTISEEEYAELLQAVLNTPVSEIKPFSRYAFLRWKLDPSFDSAPDRLQWMQAVCGRHRESWHLELERAGAMR